MNNTLEHTYYGQPMVCSEVNTNQTYTLEYTYYGQPMALTPYTETGEVSKNKVVMII